MYSSLLTKRFSSSVTSPMGNILLPPCDFFCLFVLFLPFHRYNLLIVWWWVGLLGFGVVFSVVWGFFCLWVFFLKRKLNFNETYYLMGLFFVSLLVNVFVALISQFLRLSLLPKWYKYWHVSDKSKSEGPSAFHSLYMFDILVLSMVLKG